MFGRLQGVPEPVSRKLAELGGRIVKRPCSERLAVVVFVAFYASWQVLHWIPLRQELVGDLLWLVMPAAAGWMAWGASARATAAPRLRSAWRWVALAMLVEVVTGVVELVEDERGAHVFPSFADAISLSFYPLLFIGVLRFPSTRRSGREALELALECATVAFGVGALFVYFIIGPDADTLRSSLATVGSIAYPIGDVILLVGLSSVLLRGALPAVRPSLRLMAVGASVFAFSDFVYGYAVLHGSYTSGDPVDLGYVLAFACFAFAASMQGKLESGDMSLLERGTGGLKVSWLPYVAVAVGVGTVMVKDSDESFFPELIITVSMAVILFMTIARQLLSQVSLRNSREHLAHAQEIAQIGSWKWDVLHDRIERSEEDLRLYGMSDTATAPGTLAQSLDAIHPEDRERVDSILQASLCEGRSFEYEMRVVRRDGDVRTLLVRGEVEIHGGRVTKVHGTRQDITERKRMEVQLQYQADHDPLTGLYNRRRFGEELDKALYHSARYGHPSALLILDLDHFKLINDTRGHRAGDEALTTLAHTISSRVRTSDLVGRLGGDEFGVMLHEVGPDEALTIAEDIRVTIAARQTDPPVRVTGGLLLYDGSSELIADDALIAADIALYEAKENGKDRLQVYRGSASAAVTWVDRIRGALTDGRFALFAQPMVDLHGGEVPYDELLIRMISETGELISPGEFLPVAERFGLMNEIDRWVTREGLHIAQLGNRVSINLSAHSIGDPRIIDSLREAVIAGLAPKHVIFEITESAAMRNMDEARTFAQALIELGCELALDDFGTGFGSFVYLKHLPAQYLKIDMEFVREMVFNETDRQVVDSITKVAHSLGKHTIAEGVEDQATLDVLREYGVDRAQGFFVGRPVRISPLTRFEQAARRSLAKMEE